MNLRKILDSTPLVPCTLVAHRKISYAIPWRFTCSDLKRLMKRIESKSRGLIGSERGVGNPTGTYEIEH